MYRSRAITKFRGVGGRVWLGTSGQHQWKPHLLPSWGGDKREPQLQRPGDVLERVSMRRVGPSQRLCPPPALLGRDLHQNPSSPPPPAS